jgi:hydrogenase maturation protease
VHIYVVGLGNPWASDDGAGLEVVHRLQTEWLAAGRNPEATVTFVTLPQAGLELMDFVDRGDVLILVDAVFSHAPPGTIQHEVWRAGLLAPRGTERASSHGFGIQEVLGLAAAMGRLPSQVIFWGVEVASTAPGEGLSPAVAAALPIVVGRLRRELQT